MKPGTVIDSRFEILSKLGRGGASRVFVGRDLRDQARVAIKLFDRPEFQIERFEREAALLTRFSHPGIVRYIAHGTTETGCFLVTEWVDGQTLGKHMARGLTIRDSVHVIRRIAEVLATVHERGIVHRDIKPSNIIIPGGELGRAKLLDFGIARRVGQHDDMTRTGMLIGTPSYMSPEQALRARDVDERSDIFSLGCVLYACVAGRPAFFAAHLLTTLTAILFCEPIPLVAVCPQAPPALCELVARMMAKKPEHRPQSATALARALAGLTALPDSEPRRFSRPINQADHKPLDADVCRDTVTTQTSQAIDLPDMAEGSPLFILASLGSGDDDDDDITLGERVRPVCDLVTAHDGSSAVLSDGTFVAMFGAEHSQADRTVRAARCALRLREIAPRAPMVIGHGAFASVNGVLDRLVETLIQESFQGIFRDDSNVERTKSIRLDHGLVEFLSDEFEVRQTDQVNYLIPRAPEPTTPPP